MADAADHRHRGPCAPVAGTAAPLRARLEAVAPAARSSAALTGNVVPLRPLLHNRRAVTAFIRRALETDSQVVLRGLLVDEASRHLATLTIAEGPAALSAYDPAALIEQAFLAAAAGLILVRGAFEAADLGLTPSEIAAALAVRRLGEPLNIHLLDCFAVAADPSESYRRSTNHSFASSP